jgi:hypothetical protein
MRKFSILFAVLFCSIPVFSQVTFVNAFPFITFSSPVFLTHAYDGTNRIWVVQQGGLIRVFPNDSTTTNVQTFLNVTNKISTGGERGLLGLAFHPNYENNRYFYIYYTRVGDGALIISRFTTMAGNPNKADSLSEFNLLTIPHPTYSNHNGGCLMFGSDGYLYIGPGDGGGGGDPFNNAQNTNVLLGKILRINVDTAYGGNNYGIPPGNPFIGGGGRQEIFAWGMRNPWRFSQDPVTNTIYCGDVGQDSWEEVDTLWVGKNYGWRCYEGFAPYNTQGCTTMTAYTFPIIVYHNGPPEPECSITGGYVYRGSRVSWLVGRYIYGDYCSRKVWKLRLQGGILSDTGFIGTAPSSILSFGVDQNNELYLCLTGGIYKLFDSAIGNGEPGISFPTEYSLFQNYPNPFNPSTTIKFAVPPSEGDRGMLVQLKVYDADGQEVSVIANREFSAGTHEVTWDAAAFPSGVYFYQLESGDTKLAKKMVLLR